MGPSPYCNTGRDSPRSSGKLGTPSQRSGGSTITGCAKNPNNQALTCQGLQEQLNREPQARMGDVMSA